MPLEPCKGSTTLLVAAVTITLSVNRTKAHTGEALRFTITKKVDTEYRPCNGPIQYRLPGGSWRDWWTIPAGATPRTEQSPPIPSDWACRTVEFRFYDKYMTGEYSNTVSVTISAETEFANLTASPSRAGPGDSVVISGVLRRKDTKAPVSGKTVTITCPSLGWSKSVTTRTDGVFSQTFTVPETAEPGTHTVTVSFAGSEALGMAVARIPLGAVELPIASFAVVAGIVLTGVGVYVIG